MPYKAEVIADTSGQWASNALVFETEEEARAYGNDLRARWLLVMDVRTTPVALRVNASYRLSGDTPLDRVTKFS